jgi:hypothetical protein
VRPTWALKPGLTDRLVVGRNITLTYELVEYIVQSWGIQLVEQKPVYRVYKVGVSVWNRHLHWWLNMDTEILHTPQWLNMDTPHTTPPTILHCHRNVFTELLPSNDRGIHIHTPTDWKDLWSNAIEMGSGFIKTGSGIQKLMGRYTDRKESRLKMVKGKN